VRAGSEFDVVTAVRAAGRRGLTLRAVGTGHSFNRLACSDGVLLDLSRMRGVLGLDPVRRTVTVRAGTTIGELSRVLESAGLALPNVGTLDEQTVGGAMATGNHGTGLAFGPFATTVSSLRLVVANGDVVTCSAEDDAELFAAARTSLGALGVVTAATLNCVPAFNLRVSHESLALDAMLDELPRWAGSAEHPSASWSPWRREATVRLVRRTAASGTRGARWQRYRTTMAEFGCGVAGVVGPRSPAAGLLLAKQLPPRRAPADYVDGSHHVFTFPQPVRFVALEHALALEAVAPALRELRRALERTSLHSPYSVLLRVGAADDAPLSPAFGRTTGYVNLTVPRHPRYTELLRVVESVMRAHDGRPHWGKAHTADADVLAPRYPKWSAFAQLRRRLDPKGLFTSEYLRHLLGPVDAAEWLATEVIG